MKYSIFGLIILLFSLQSNALVKTGTVTQLGCHHDQDHCFVRFSFGAVTGVCNGSDSIRWGSGTNMHNSGRLYSTLLAAKMSGNKIEVSIPDGTSSCYSGFPTIGWLLVKE